jgi:hypothetical protein
VSDRAPSFRAVSLLCLCAALALTTGCTAPAAGTATPVVTATSPAAAAATATPVPATATSVPATATSVPATATSAPATATSAPPSPTAAPAAATTAATPAPAAAGDARSALGDVFRGWSGVKSFRARVDAALTPGATPQPAMQMEVLLPDRMRGTVNAGGQTLEMVMIGGTAYIKLPTGQWMRSPGQIPVDFTGLDPKRFESDFQRDVTNVRLVGPDVVEGTPTLAYTYDFVPSTPTKPGVKPGPQTAKLWVGVADRLPRRFEVAGGPTAGTVTVTYYDYGAPITIDAPAA